MAPGPSGIDKLSWWSNLLSVANHGIFAALFIWRNIHAGGDFNMERAIRAEAGTLCAVQGCDPFDVAKHLVASLTEMFPEMVAVGPTISYASIFMYWYMLLEGCIHCCICIGGFRILLPGPSGARPSGFWAQRLYRVSLLSEIIIMDIFYMYMFTAFPLMYANSNLINTKAGSFSSGAHFGFFVAFLSMLNHTSCILDVWAYIIEVMRTPMKVASD
eukprot:gnl/TRDRNA2_/TRDRNA2_36775_c0_seq1.p1 gnl/TRDRNA2_/TRDRNA2_36775_c0~~gnl/TRDRNA2_/TRDRNA2_36775_c0_seq1.p1  ORF type:complete len:216 (+),score=27.15 gnl/TRDRNA2_/TRDRNA2_36775_c0_seq1:70-717(+)